MLGCMILLAGCQQKSAKDVPVTKKGFAMNTMVDMTIYGSEASTAAVQIEREIKQLDALLSATIRTSDIAKLNASPDTWVTVDEDASAALNQAWRYKQLTNGAFHPTIGKLINLWGINVDNQKIPNPDQISEAQKSITDDNLLSEANRQYMLTHDAKIDLGGIGKGYATEKAKEIVEERDVNAALVSLGSSSILAYGKKPDGSDWKVGIHDFDSQKDDYFGIVSLKDAFLSTTGDYEHFFIQDGVRYHHVIDPKTGYPADTGLRSVTVVSDNGAMSDAYSTALMVMGLEKSLQFQKEQGNFEAILVTKQKRIICTDGIRKNFEFTGKAAGYPYE